MKQLYKFKSNFFFYGIMTALMFCTITWKTEAYAAPVTEFCSPLTMTADTTKPLLKNDSIKNIPIRLTDTTKKPVIDSVFTSQKIDTFSLKVLKGFSRSTTCLCCRRFCCYSDCSIKKYCYTGKQKLNTRTLF